jgi:hypothetical protein
MLGAVMAEIVAIIAAEHDTVGPSRPAAFTSSFPAQRAEP